MSPDAGAPAVSVIVATYNRSNVLALALASLRAQTFRDWEAWVIGDACTDDTAAVVGSFEDDRIRFVNLPENHGDQSGPNNEGVRRARGRYVAYLNHDDLWFHDHLERTVAAMAELRADVLFTVPGVVASDGRVVLVPSWSGNLEARVAALASAWLVRRETAVSVGPWRSREQCFDAPSRDWLLRAQAAGHQIRQLPAVTLLACSSVNRPGSYLRRDEREQSELWSRMRNAGFREALLEEVAVRASAELLRPKGALATLRALPRDVVTRQLGLRASTVRLALRYRRRGGFVEDLRRIRGLESR